MMISLRFLCIATLFAELAASYLVNPPTTAPSDTISDCSNWAVAGSTDTCAGIASAGFITLTQFNTYNPSQASSCKLVIGDSYCVEENFGVPPSSTTSHAASTSTGISTPLPVQTGMVKTCNAFYLVVSGDQCGTVASSHGISLANFYAWNPAVGSTCTTLIAGDYVCVGIVGGASVTTTAKSTPTNGISTPAPIQTGMVTSCNKFYLVVSGDQCGTVASSNGVSLANFYAWNPAVGSTCTTLIAGDYVCVGVIGGTTITTTGTTSKASASATATVISSKTYSIPPAPTGTGSTPQCNTWYTIQAGDTCQSIDTKFGITTAELVAWNTYINGACSNLLTGNSLCILSSITPTTFSWWTPLGCYADSSSSRTLRNNIMNSATSMTIESCQSACLAAGYSLAGVEWGQECFCDNTLQGSLAPDGNAQCNVACAGNSAETCGGSLRVDVYMHSQTNALGCFADSTSTRTLTQYKPITNQASIMTLELCQNTCLSAGYLYSAVEWGQECFCDNAFHGSPAPDGKAGCNMACPGNSAETCGGSLRLSVTSLPPYHAVGCYTDSSSSRTLNNYILGNQGGSMTIELCQNACRNLGYRLAGLEYAQECFCDNDIQGYGKPAPEGNAGCNMACSGNSKEICGGNLRLSLFAL